MAADLQIHVYEYLEESDLRNFFNNTMGSVYFGAGDGLKTVDDMMIAVIKSDLRNAAPHEYYSCAELKDLIEFLESVKGKQVFTVSW